MRSKRLVVALTVAALTAGAASPAAAQGNAVWDLGQNSWYFGVYGGETSFPTTIARTTAPTLGVDWMITRRRFALNVFAEQSYFNAVSTVPDFPTSAPRRVDMRDMRRVGASAMLFLPSYKYMHPWAGVGYAMNFVPNATAQGSSFASPAARDSIVARVDDARAQAKSFLDLGMMYVRRNWAPFLQYSIMPTKGSSSWLVNGEGMTNVWKAGLRYNFGSAIDERW
ncbi:MAG: hypothetical protein FJ202_06430 [Gemmatimonadetes bacterium]|nr:hypothetical protein [Gemmatimonadota bacterium]